MSNNFLERFFIHADDVRVQDLDFVFARRCLHRFLESVRVSWRAKPMWSFGQYFWVNFTFAGSASRGTGRRDINGGEAKRRCIVKGCTDNVGLGKGCIVYPGICAGAAI